MKLIVKNASSTSKFYYNFVNKKKSQKGPKIFEIKTNGREISSTLMAFISENEINFFFHPLNYSLLLKIRVKMSSRFFLQTNWTRPNVCSDEYNSPLRKFWGRGGTKKTPRKLRDDRKGWGGCKNFFETVFSPHFVVFWARKQLFSEHEFGKLC